MTLLEASGMVNGDKQSPAPTVQWVINLTRAIYVVGALNLMANGFPPSAIAEMTR